MQLKTTFKFLKNDEAFYVGAYVPGSLTEGEPTLLFNVECMIDAVKGEEEKGEIFRDILLSTATHEFCHAMQEWLQKEFDELEVEKILGQYNEKRNVLEAEGTEEDAPVFRINDLLEWLDQYETAEEDPIEYKNGTEDLKNAIRQIFSGFVLWKEAEEKHKVEKQAEKVNEIEKLLKEAFLEFRPHIGGHNTAMNKYFDAIDKLKTLQ